jgi:hypothetical protein
MAAIRAKLDMFRGESRFTTWARRPATSRPTSVTGAESPPAGGIARRSSPSGWPTTAARSHDLLALTDRGSPPELASRILSVLPRGVSATAVRFESWSPCPMSLTRRRRVVDEEAFNMSVRKFLKTLGVTAQREIELMVREQLASGDLEGDETLAATATVTVAGLSRDVVVTGKISLAR